MTPREFLDQVVRLNVVEFHNDDANMRHAYNAVAAVDSLAAHIYVWCLTNAPAKVAGLIDDTQYRATLAGAHDDFRLLRDIAKAQKHVKLTRGTPTIADAEQISARPLGWDEAPFDYGRFDGPLQVAVEIEIGTVRHVGLIVDGALQVLEDEMARLNI